MGYYTKYTLRTEPPEAHGDVEAMLPADVCRPERWANFEPGCKWYSHRADCINASARMPDVLIEITGLGEDKGDHWRLRYLGGRLVGDHRLTDPRVGHER
jgi:hypothetical protein